MVSGRRAVAALLLIALAALMSGPLVAEARTRVFVGVGPIWWDPFWLFPYAPYGAPYWVYPPPYYVYAPPPVVVEEPPVYIQREAPLAPGYWYYCPSPNAQGYYPTVPSCPEPWIQVPPR